jgi:type III secretion protein D
MLELRILSGLHRGATLPLDDDTVVIGSDESADVVLLDPGIETTHASLRKTSEGWALSSLDGEVLSSDTNEPLKSLDLQQGEFGRLGRVWVSVVDSDAAWGEPPPDPVDIEADDLQGDKGDSEERQSNDAEHMHATTSDESSEAGGTQGEGTDEEADVEGRQGKPGRTLATIGLITVLAAWGAYQLVGGAAGAVPLKPGIASAGSATLTASGTGPGQTGKPAALSQEELRMAFRQRLDEVGLLKSFDLHLRDNDWNMKAALDDEEAARFERTLASFVAQHKITFPVTAKVGNAEHMLPFKIRQVISGANASVVTLDGNRLYVGDVYQGTRLVAVNGSRLTFMGKRKIEVRW